MPAWFGLAALGVSKALAFGRRLYKYSPNNPYLWGVGYAAGTVTGYHPANFAFGRFFRRRHNRGGSFRTINRL